MKLRYFLSVLLLSCGVLACSNSKPDTGTEVNPAAAKEMATDSVENYVKKEMNDPGSYELAAITDYSVFTERDSLGLALALKEATRHLIGKDSLAAHDAVIEDIKQQLAHTDTSGNRVISYSLVHSFRGKNKLGALVLNKYAFRLDRNFKIVEAKEVE